MSMQVDLHAITESIAKLGEKAVRLYTQIESEEATKQALVIPFLILLGYDVYDPTEVVPEFTADIGTKKGEKVDYAVLKSGQPILIIECKRANKDLDDEDISQLYRYFSVTNARIAALTNGVYYKFFTDLERQNIMDQTPFLEFDIRSVSSNNIIEIAKLHKSSFNEEDLISSASTLRFKQKARLLFEQNIKSPTDDFTRVFITQIYNGRITSSIMSKFKELLHDAMSDVIREQVEFAIKRMLEQSQSTTSAITTPSVLDISSHMSLKQQDHDKIQTTDIEAQGFQIVVDIISDFVDIKRVIWRDVSSYFGVLLDDNNRKPICRLHFNGTQKYISLFDSEDRQEDKVAIVDVMDIRKYKVRLVKTILHYLDQDIN